MECIFCKIVDGQIPADLISQAPTHVLIIPKKHIEKISDLNEEDEGLVGKMVLVAKKIAEDEGISESGFRLVFNNNKDAGQEVFHIHLHLLGGRKFSWPPG